MPAAGSLSSEKRRSPPPPRTAQVPHQDNSKSSGDVNLSERSTALSPPAAGSSNPEGRRTPAGRTPSLSHDDNGRPRGADVLPQRPGPTAGSANPEKRRMPMARPAQSRSKENSDPHHEIEFSDGLMPETPPRRQPNTSPSRLKALNPKNSSNGEDNLPRGSMAKPPPRKFNSPQSRLRALDPRNISNGRMPPSAHSGARYCDGTNCEWRPKSIRTEEELAATKRMLVRATAEIQRLKMMGPQKIQRDPTAVVGAAEGPAYEDQKMHSNTQGVRMPPRERQGQTPPRRQREGAGIMGNIPRPAAAWRPPPALAARPGDRSPPPQDQDFA
ncbi:hypothetical protein EPUS_01414 [Endocarpon pusillum Z07020]|uniref:Uncharacterized protein n=1 Tax=Endocarpon pusillum (strain Z07020 / HMAS-L-300199) TaxID=1263415 RepID=U1GVJ6_ENDPU|nr:uncharacterized protein EPUS_01414 [Endocarpon pusillum Z07020]ERF76081.1 hypothetical protein EPUS_01414 [Endocarpon pusillum Z07020]